MHTAQNNILNFQNNIKVCDALLWRVAGCYVACMCVTHYCGAWLAVTWRAVRDALLWRVAGCYVACSACMDHLALNK